MNTERQSGDLRGKRRPETATGIAGGRRMAGERKPHQAEAGGL